MKRFIASNFKTIEWSLGVFVFVVSVLAWIAAGGIGADGQASLYEIFPPLGLVAFGLMWTHFVMGALRRYAGVTVDPDRPYMAISMGLVLALIILHPTILWIALYLDGFGLPPASHIHAYQPQVLAVFLGTISLTIFLSFELKRWFGQKSWWRFVDMAQIVAMAAIFYHALKLGNELRLSWFALIWWGYGLTLVAAIIYTYIAKREGKRG